MPKLDLVERVDFFREQLRLIVEVCLAGKDILSGIRAHPYFTQWSP